MLLGLAENEFNVFARVVIVTIMMSHLIHFLTALLREMARGIHQYDAIIEALAITHQPILLSSLTTILGFVMVALFNATFTEMAYQIIYAYQHNALNFTGLATAHASKALWNKLFTSCLLLKR